MIDESLETPSTRPSRLRTIGLVALGLVAGTGGTLLLRPSMKHGHEAETGATASAPKKQMYQCPMHPHVVQDHPGSCPICGMTMVPIVDKDTPKDKGKVVFYRSPMNPSLTSPVPMKDEMGMDYVAVYEGDLKADAGSLETHATVTIDHERQQLIGLRTEEVKEGAVGGEVRTVARVAVDETRVRKVNVKVDGFVEKLFVDFTGKPVAQGAPLFSLYSPEFVSAQREYLLALRTQKSMGAANLLASGQELLDAAKRRLQLWDVPAAEVERLEKTGEVEKTLTLRSPIKGVVTAKNVVEGARIGPSDFPFEITDLSRVWAYADVYEPELPRVKMGQAATLTLVPYPGRTFHGKVVFIDPVLDPKTRTVKVRLEFPNADGALKPEMFGEALVKTTARRGLVVPRDAVLDAGTRKVAFVALGEGRFSPREVRVGASQGEDVEVLSGLEKGDLVVVRANFLVDSESRLQAALAHMAMKPEPAAPSGQQGHQGHQR